MFSKNSDGTIKESVIKEMYATVTLRPKRKYIFRKVDDNIDIMVDKCCKYYISSPPSISPSIVAGGKVGARLPSIATLSLVSNTDSLCLSCLVTSSR